VQADSIVASEGQPGAVHHEGTKNTNDPLRIFVTFVTFVTFVAS